ncbi:MAG: flagellar hook-length control protein FliK [Phycisphaeraceae bacterium]
MKVDNTTLRQLSLGNDSARNSKSAQSAEPDAFGQLFASLTRTSQSAQGGAAEAAPSARLSKGKTEDDARVERDRAGDVEVKKRGEGESDADADVNADASGDVTAPPETGAAAGVAAQERRTEVKAKSEGDGGDAENAGGKNAGEQVTARIGEAKTGGGELGNAKPQAAEATAAPEVAEASQSRPVGQEELKATDAQSQSRSQIQTAVIAEEQGAKADRDVANAKPQAAGGRAEDARLDILKREDARRRGMERDAGGAKPQAAGEAEQPQQQQQTAPGAAVRGAVNAAAGTNQQVRAMEDRTEDADKWIGVNAGQSAGVATETDVSASAPAGHAGTNTPTVLLTAHANAAGAGAGTTTLSDAEAQQVLQQALGSVRTMSATGPGPGRSPGSGHGGTVTLRLNPPELGALRIAVRMDGPTLSATFEASSATVSSLLEGQMHALRSALERVGLSVDQLNVQGPSPLPMPVGPGQGAHFGSAQQQMNQSASDGRSRGWMGDGGRSPGRRQPGQNQGTSPGFQRELLNLVA